MQSYNAFHKEIQDYWLEGEPEKVLEALRDGLEIFHQHQSELLFEGIMACIELGRDKQALELMELADSRGFWYPSEVFPESEMYHDLVQKWTAMRRNTNPRILEVGHETREHQEPIMLAFHGWGEDLNLFRRYFSSAEFERRGRIHYLQSSQQIGSVQYVWNNRKQAEKDVRHYLCSAFDNVEVYAMGGFSQGAYLALDLVLCNSVRVKKLILVCPGREDYALENIKILADEGVEVLLISGTDDYEHAYHNKLNELMQTAGVKVTYRVVQGMKHWFPDNLDDYIDDFL